MKVACLQFYPLFKQPLVNMSSASALLQKYLSSSQVDLVVLPEMCFCGYEFTSRLDIQPFLEDLSSTCPSLQWAQQHCVLYKCMIVLGLPIKESNDNEEKYYNAQIMVDKHGRLLHVYRKHFLYSTDEQWSHEGPAFSSVNLEQLGLKVGFGICMDVNPYRFQSAFEVMEFAEYHRQQGTQLLLCSMNWLTHDNQPQIPDRNTIVTSDIDDIENIDIDIDVEMRETERNLRYWLLRLSKLIGTDCQVVICNRVGREFDTVFCGNSCIIDLQSVKVVGWLGRTEESVLIRSIR